jgi:hypothetical protein
VFKCHYLALCLFLQCESLVLIFLLYTSFKMKFLSLVAVLAFISVASVQVIMADEQVQAAVEAVEAVKEPESVESGSESQDVEERHRRHHRRHHRDCGCGHHHHRRHCHKCKEHQPDCLSSSSECDFCQDGCENGNVIRIPAVSPAFIREALGDLEKLKQ